MAVSLEELSKALVSLEEALTVEKTDISRDASIQRFEFCVELSWKSAKKVMGTSTAAPKQVIREMAQSGFIENVEFWLKSISVHSGNSCRPPERAGRYSLDLWVSCARRPK